MMGAHRKFIQWPWIQMHNFGQWSTRKFVCASYILKYMIFYVAFMNVINMLLSNWALNKTGNTITCLWRSGLCIHTKYLILGALNIDARYINSIMVFVTCHVTPSLMEMFSVDNLWKIINLGQWWIVWTTLYKMFSAMEPKIWSFW